MRKLGLGCLILGVGLFSACISKSPESAKKQVLTPEQEESLSRITNKEPKREVAGTLLNLIKKRAQNQIAVYLKDHETVYIDDPKLSFDFQNNSAGSIAKLKNYILSKPEVFGVTNKFFLGLELSKLNTLGSLTSIQLQQVVDREISGEKHQIQINGAGLVLMMRNGRLVSINSSVTEPPSFKFIFSYPGIDLSAFSTKELQVLQQHIEFSRKREEVRQAILNLAQQSRPEFDFGKYDQMDRQGQLSMVLDLFKKLNADTTVKMLLDLTKRKRISLTRYGKSWYFQLSHLFDLPIEFDFSIPEEGEQGQIKARNLRELKQDYSFSYYDAPNHPQAPYNPALRVPTESSVIPENSQVTKTAKIFQKVYNYFDKNYGWKGYEGKNPNGNLNVFVGIKTAGVIENAHWDPNRKEVAIGAGGNTLVNLQNSPSVLGHEFSHAIISSTSNLIYQNQSGALNEHFADVQGAIINSEYVAEQKGGVVKFIPLVGDDVIEPQQAAIRAGVLVLALASRGMNADQIQENYLNITPLRNMIQPTFGFSSQVDNFAAAQQKYGPTCQPSAFNDSCGVHDQSGVVNRAATLIINRLGIVKTKRLFFNTLAFRLGPNSNFSEYARQLVEECVEGLELNPQTECPIVLESLKEVGLNVPDIRFNSRPTPPAPEQVPQDVPSAPQKEDKYCGWISVSPSRNVTVIDNKFDVVLFGPNSQVISQGDFDEIYNYKCGCAVGTLAKTRNSKGTEFNYLSRVSSVREVKASGCQGIIFK